MLPMIVQATGLSYCMIWSLIQVETNGRFLTRLDGYSLSYGYVQIKYTTAKDFEPELEPRHLRNPYNNIYYGALYLQKQIKRCGFESGIQAYNTGNCRTKNYKHLKRYKKYLNKCLVTRPEKLPHNFLK
jgi:soluble lytic murein transglycosylase-like protein